MPTVPSPDECQLEEDRFIRMSKEDDLHPAVKSYCIAYSAVSLSVLCLAVSANDSYNQDRTRSPIAVKAAIEHDVSKDGIIRYMYWMKARNIPEYEAPFQKVFSSLSLF